MINRVSTSVLLLVLLSIGGCGFVARDKNVLAINNNAPGTPKDIMLSQLYEPLNGFGCRVIATIPLDNFEPLEACFVTVSFSDPQNSNSVFFYKGKYVGHGGIGTFPPRFKRQIEEQLTQEAERNKPKPSVVDSTPQPRPSLSQPIPPKREPLLKGSGTGFYINSDGYLLTNYHVVEGCSYLARRSRYDGVIAEEPMISGSFRRLYQK